MIDKSKAVFLPIDNRVLNLFKGYILNGELLQIAESEVYIETKYYTYINSISKTERIAKIIIVISLIPIIIPIFLVATIFKKFDQVSDKLKSLLNSFFNYFFQKKKDLLTMRIKNEKYNDAIEENIPEFLNHCKKNFAKVYLYSFHDLKSEEKLKVDNLIASGLIYSYKSVSKLPDLIPLINAEKISLQNSLLIISDSIEKKEANLSGFLSSNGFKCKVVIWKMGKMSSKTIEDNLNWDFQETILGMKGEIEYYLKAKSKAFLTNDFILFIEDSRDDFLNKYIQKNLKAISNRLEDKGMRLIYFPSFQNEAIKLHESIIQFIKYRIPILYSLADSELNDVIQVVLQKLTPEEFYRIVLEELELPFFKRPCLLRNISEDISNTENKFTYKHIEYQTEKDLDKLFEGYINQIENPNNSNGIKYQMHELELPADYDADWYFNEDSRKDTDELKQKIDAIKEEGKYGVLVEAIMYMLATIKEEKPEIINKVRPLLEKKKLLESKVILSSILIDNNYNIFLPDFGNIEVKMHALPKTVYILFLRYPRGIRFKELYLYKHELLEIYNKLTNKYEKPEIEKAINDLVDMTNPSINQKCARIREAFRNIMDEHIAKHYYIDGLNGEPKKISLPKIYIDIRY